MAAEESSGPDAGGSQKAGAESAVDAIYQKNKVVGRAEGVEMDREPGKIFFTEIHNSDTLLLPDECEFRGHTILIKKIGYATYIDRQSHDKGRILQEVVADILSPARTM